MHMGFALTDPEAPEEVTGLTVISCDITDDVDFIHGDLPVSELLSEADGSRLRPLHRISLDF